MENNNNEPYNPAQPFSTQPIPAQPKLSMSSQRSSKTIIVLFIILIIVIISAGVVLYIVNQPSRSSEPAYTQPSAKPPAEPSITNTLQSVITPTSTITPTLDEELQSLDNPIDATADLQDIDADLQQL